MPQSTETQERLVEQVKEKYGQIAKTGGSCAPSGPGIPCCGGGAQTVSLQIGYKKEEQAAVPEGADLGLGCGAPIPHLEPKPGRRSSTSAPGAGSTPSWPPAPWAPRARSSGST